MITIQDIENHPAQAETKTIFSVVENLIDGRIPHDHMTLLYVLREMLAEQCRTYLEIGVHNGGSMAVVMQSKHTCQFYGVDMFEKVLEIPRWEYFRADNLSYDKTINNIKKCNIHDHNFQIIKGNSRSQEIIDAVSPLNAAQDTIVDLLFIDGDHTYVGVKADFTNYSPLVSSGGIVVFDDYNLVGHPDIVKFVNELDDPAWRKIGVTTNSFVIQKA